MDHFDTGIATLFSLSMVLAASHALSPDHWFPFVVIGRANNWRTSSVLGLAFLAALGHVLSSITVGLVSLFAEGASAEAVETLRDITPALLVVFGSVYALISYYRLRVSHHGHSHGFVVINKWLGIDPHDYEMHDHDDMDETCADDHQHKKAHCDCPKLPGRHLSSKAAWGLVAILGITPCLTMVPVTFAAQEHGMGTVVLVNVVFAVSALISILVATFLALRGLKLIKLSFFDKWGSVTAGLIIVLIGVAGFIFEHGHHHHLH